MKRRICAWTALLVLVFTISVSAAARADAPSLSLWFDGTTANCEVDVWGSTGKDTVSITVKLWHGSTCLATWYQSGDGQVNFSKTHTNGIRAGETYEMTVKYTIAGKTYPTVETSAICHG